THEASLFMVLQAAFAALLSRYSGESDIVVGTPVAGRLHPDVEPLIGFFVNTLVLRTRVDAGASFASLVDHVRATALAAYEHQEVPFEMLVEELQPPRHLAHSPLFQVTFALRNNDYGTFDAMGVEVIPITDTDGNQAKFDLQVFATEDADGLALAWVYADSLFERDTIARMADAFELIVHAAASAPDTVVAQLPCVTPGDLARMRAWNDTASAGVPSCCLHELFEAEADRVPDAIAVAFGRQAITYAELDRRANRLAHALCATGAGPDDRVAILLDRGIEMIVAMLAVLKAGAAYLPVDPAYPAERIAFMLEDAAPVVVIAPVAQHAMLRGAGHAAVACEGSGNASRPDARIRGLVPASLAYVIYTSGSTGKPKGVMVEHASIVASNEARRRFYAPRASALLVPSFAFDSSVATIFWTLTTGATLVLATAEQARDARELAKLVRAHAVEAWLSVPSLYDALLAAADDGDLDSLRTVIVAGEALPPHVLPRHVACLPQTGLFNEYGPTEASVWCSVDDVLRGGRASTASIGGPIANATLHVLDAHGQAVPVGVVGEIHVGGAGLTRGYLRRAELTEDRFLSDRPGAGMGTRVYRTGDLGRWLADGTVEYLGRNDFQLKVRGFRIEPGEIEAHLAECEGVDAAAVLGVSDGAGAQRLVAYVAGDGIEVAVLRATLSRRLAEYMMPAAFVVLPALPLNANGKLDRAALPAPAEQRRESGPADMPRGDIEAQLAAIWSELLGVDVFRPDHFFELGGHSLLLMRLASRIRETWSVDIAVRDLFAAPAFIDMAGLVAERHMQVFLGDAMALMSDELDGLSEEELMNLLNQETTDE
ncbi:MAG: non-ribosomal peptide synthetase, partial [Rhodanobacter sp.]